MLILNILHFILFLLKWHSLKVFDPFACNGGFSNQIIPIIVLLTYCEHIFT
jgi:hypothetical protein